jgi:hypothetical protein
MQNIISISLIVLALLVSFSALANPPCPQSANRLEDFALCMRPFPNGRGQYLVSYSSGGMDNHTAQLMNSLNYTPLVAPHVYPAVSAVSFMSNMAVAMAYVKKHPWDYPYYGSFYPFYPFYMFRAYPYAYVGVGVGP